MYFSRSWTLCCLVGILLYSGCTLCDMILPSFHWNHRNTIFQRRKPGEGTTLCRDPAHIFVPYGSEFYFICPNKVMDVAKSDSRVKKYSLFENIHMVNEDGFNNCRIDRSNSLVLNCDQSLKVNALKFELVMFFSVTWNGRSFKPNETYYFINTSNGTMAGLDRTSGGKCRTHNMRLKVTVCHREQECAQCKNLCCQKPPTTKPPTTAATTTQTTTATETSSERSTTRNVLKSEPMSATPTKQNSVTMKTDTERKLAHTIETKSYRSKAEFITTSRPRTKSIESDSHQKIPNGETSNCSLLVRAAKSRDNRLMLRDSMNFSPIPFVIGIIVGAVIISILAIVWHVYRKRYKSNDASAATSGTKNGKSFSKPIYLAPDSRGANGKGSEFQRLQSSSSSDSGSGPTNV